MERLVKKAMKRNEKALEALLYEYQEYLYRMAYAYCRNEQNALDAVSECVMKVYINLPKLRRPEYFKTWMTRILINEVLSDAGKEKVLSLEALQEGGVLPEEPQRGLSPEIGRAHV